MAFRHECLSNEEAHQEQTRRLAAAERDLPRVCTWLVSASLAAVIATIGWVFLMLGAVALEATFAPQSRGWIALTMVIAIAGCLLGLTWFHWAAERETDVADERAAIRQSFAPATTVDLGYLAEQRERHAEVGKAVAAWLRHGLTIRQRDVAAVREYVAVAAHASERGHLLRVLSAPTRAAD